ncbi:hypothetical protein RQM59_07805 [Flavobacteriaceae bacterium S356]|uniref:Long-subunit fatty acid transport protein n=1 Tax=Asprobacillus argus TaxID=3076534 RepID=A0ABU3LEX0_9FLAO|nr:hypothetical protein [Flavobacteriaceae bacterium S356]
MIKKGLIVITLLVSVSVFSQRTVSSPYSFFGVGEEFKPRTIEQASMGGLGAAYNSLYQINLTNPAAAAYLRYSTYTFGLLNNDLTIDDGTKKQSTTTTNLNYFTIGFPLGTKAGAHFGLQPVSAVGYSLVNNVFDADETLIERTLFKGNGGLNRIYGSFGIFAAKNLSLGVELDFVFGNVENSIRTQRSGVQLATKNLETANVRGGAIKLGVQYKKELKDKLMLDVGASLKLSNTFNANGREYLYSLAVGINDSEAPRDTVYNVASRGKLKNPLEAIIGVGLGKESKWYLGAEYEQQDAIVAEGYFDTVSDAYKFGNSNRISIGGFYIPNVNAINGYWKRIKYSAGVRFEDTGLLVNGSSTSNTFTSIKDFGMSFGLSLPLGKGLSNINLGFEYGKRGTTSNGLIQENYFNVRVGLSLNDIWFIKRRID